MAIHPVPIYDGRDPHTTSGFGPRTGGLYAFHYGNDILFPWKQGDPVGLPQQSKSDRWVMPNGWPVLSARAGRVIESKQISTGGYVAVDHGDGMTTHYMHLRNRLVKVGQNVGEGTRLATISYSLLDPDKLNHLHFEVHQNGTPVDPLPYLKAWRKVEPPLQAGSFLIVAGSAAIMAWGIHRLRTR